MREFNVTIRFYEEPCQTVQMRMQEKDSTNDFACTCGEILDADPLGVCFDVLTNKLREILRAEGNDMGAVAVNMPRPKYNACYQCTKREVGCHSKCKEYLDARNERIEEWRGRAEAARKENIVTGFKVNAVMKSSRRKLAER